MKRTICLVGLFLFVVFTVPMACKQTESLATKEIPDGGNDPETVKPELFAILYQQTAAEYRALCYQAFNLARWRLEEAVRNRKADERLSVVVDLDETILNNSPYEAMRLLQNVRYPEGWDEWVKSAEAAPIPGAMEFLQFTRENRVEVYYISNRSEKYFSQTLQTLQRLNFPFAQEDHLLLKRSGPSKKERRETVASRTAIVLLIGDNLNDFSEAFEKLPVQERAGLTDRFRDNFGTRFIVLPNPIYGDWISALYDYNEELTTEEKLDLLIQALKPF